MFERKASRRTIAIMAILVLGIYARPSLARADAVVGKITQASGKAQVKRGSATFDAAPAMPVELHDQLTTGTPGQLTFQMLDNSILTLNESSVLTVDETVVGGGAGTTRVGLVSGSVRSLVTAVARTAAPKFELKTPNAIAGVRGTDFKCRYEQAARPAFPNCFQFTDCETTEGTVEVTNNPSKPGVVVKVGPGYMTTVACLAAPLSATPGTLAALGTGGAATAGAATATLSTPLIIGAGLGAAAIIGGTVAGVVEATSGGGAGPVASPSQ